MSVSALRLCRLRCTYSILSRTLSDKYHSQRLDLSVCKFGRLAQFTHGRAIWKVPCNARSCTGCATRQDADLEYRDSRKTTTATTLPELIRENDYARDLFLSSNKYAASVMPLKTTYAHVTNEEALELLEQDWSSLSDEKMLSAVKKLSYNIQYSNEVIEPSRYQSAIEALILRCRKFTDDKVIVMMRHLALFRQRLVKCQFYYHLCVQLDKECMARFMMLPTNDMLLLCDIMYELIHRPTSNYIWSVMRKLGNKPNRLLPHQLVQVLFFLNVCRKPPINMYELEYRMEHCLDELSVNELGIAALGFFKTGTMIRSTNLLNRIMQKTINEIEYVDSVSIGGIVKLVRYSMQLEEINTFKALLNVIMPHEPRFTLMTLTHIGHACARIAVYHKEFIDRLITRLNNEIKTARLKDFERLIFVLTSFNIDSSNSIYHNVIEELRATLNTSRAKEITRHPHAISRLLGFMSYMNIYPTDLIRHVMLPDFIHKTCFGNYHYISREYCVLDYSLRVEVPEYHGPFLTPNQCSFLIKRHLQENKSTDATRTNVLLTNVMEVCQEIFNSTSDITVDRPLPHYVTPDVIFCLDEHNQLVPTEKFLSSFGPEEVKRVDKENAKNVRWIALVMAPHALVIRDTTLPVGLLAARIRQLSTIGYTPIMITQTDWNKRRLPEERCNYIKSLIFKNTTSDMTNT